MKYIKCYEDYSIYTNDIFWGTVGAGILVISKNTGRILLGLRSSQVNEPNTWGIFGGQLDDMETNDPKKAALIELEEETGYRGKINLIDGEIFTKTDTDGNNIFTYYNYIGIIQDEYTPVLDWENDDYKWLTFDELLKLRKKHFGLEFLIKNSKNLIKKYT